MATLYARPVTPGGRVASVGVVSTPIILIPGFWLNASSWDEVAAALAPRGFAVTDEERAGIGLRDHVAAVVAAVDAAGGPVVLVGHSAGGALAHAAADARPEAVRGVIYVDSLPMGEGECVNDELPVIDGEIPLPDWSVFGEEDLVDLSEELRAAFRERSVPVPAGVARDLQHLSDARRYEVPSVVIACEFSGGEVQAMIAEGRPWTAEVGAMKDLRFVDLPTGHWPQFTRGADLVEVLTSILSDWRVT